MSGEDDPRNWGSAQPEGPAGGVPEVVVPDDLSELEAEISAYRREQRARRRREHWRDRHDRAPRVIRWMLPTGRERAVGFSGRDQRRMLPLAITATALLLSVIVTVLLTVLAPKPVEDTRKGVALATTTIADGMKGGLLPNIYVSSNLGGAGYTQSLRPAVVISLPDACGCQKTVDDIEDDATAQHVSTYAITPNNPRAQSPIEAQKALPNSSFNDGSRKFSETFGDGKLTAVVVEPNGIIYDVLIGDTQIEDQLVSDLQFAFAGSG